MKKFGLIAALSGIVLAGGAFARPSTIVSAAEACADTTYFGDASVKFGGVSQGTVEHAVNLTFDANCAPSVIIAPVNSAENGGFTADTAAQPDFSGWKTLKTAVKTWKATLKTVEPELAFVQVNGVDQPLRAGSTFVFKQTSVDTFYFKLVGTTTNGVSVEIESSGTGLPVN